MTTNLSTRVFNGQVSPWFRVAQFLLIVTLVVAIYLLGLEMVHHRFFQGGRLDQYSHIRQ